MISKEKWAEIIKGFQEKPLPEVFLRDIKIRTELPIQRAVSIIGPRRAGKTYEMFCIIKELEKRYKIEDILYVNFERADLGALSYDSLAVMLDTFNELSPDSKKWLFLDEIQNVYSWEKFARSCLDQGIKIFLSGSSSKLLSKEIATSMRGRNLTYKILPFSFKEYLRYNNFAVKEYFSSAEKSRLLSLLKEYFYYGGYPEAVIYKEEREKILRDVFDTAIYRDVIERAKVRNIKAMKMLISALISSNEFSVHKFYKFLKTQGIKISKNALYNYMGHLNDAFFIFPLKKFSLSYKKSEHSIPKIYYIDNGLLTINGIDDRGKLMENLVFIELMRKERDIAYYRSVTGEEADFIIKSGKKVKQVIQVCYNLENFMTKEREFKALVKAGKDLKCKNLKAITWDESGEKKFKGKKISVVPLWKFLLSE